MSCCWKPRRRLRPGRGSFSPCERQRLHTSADQLLFGSTPGRGRSAGQGVFHVRRDMASGAVRGATRTLLRSTAEGSGSGALSGSTNEEARSACRFDTARAVASAGTLAGKLRSLLGDVEATARPAVGNTCDDRGSAALL